MHRDEAETFLRDYKGDRLAIEPEFGELLYDMIVDNEPEVIVEVGTAKGYSACWMILAMEKIKKSKLITIDSQEAPDIYLWNKLNLPTKRLKILKGTLSENISKIPHSVGLVFLDSDHQIHNIVNDIELLTPHVVAGGKMVIHDVNYCRDMGNLLANYFDLSHESDLKHCGVNLPGDSSWEFYEEITKQSGLGIATKKGEN